MIIPGFDLALARSMLDGVTDESAIDRYGALVEADSDMLTELEVTTFDGTKIRLGDAGSDQGPGPAGNDQGTGDPPGDVARDDSPPGPDADRRGEVAPGALHGLRGTDVASSLDRARILNLEARKFLEHLLHDPDACRRLGELARELGYKADGQDDLYALLSDLLQHASWAAAGHVYRRLEIEAAQIGRSAR